MFNPIKFAVDVEHQLEARYFAAAGVVGALTLTIMEEPQSYKATPAMYQAGKDAFYKYMVRHNIVTRNVYPFQLWALNDGFKATAEVLTALDSWFTKNEIETPVMLEVSLPMKDMPPLGFGLILLGISKSIEGWAWLLDDNIGENLAEWEAFVSKDEDFQVIGIDI